MKSETRIAAALCFLAVLFVSAGAASFSAGAGLIVFGTLLAAWTVLFLDLERR